MNRKPRIEQKVKIEERANKTDKGKFIGLRNCIVYDINDNFVFSNVFMCFFMYFCYFYVFGVILSMFVICVICVIYVIFVIKLLFCSK